jgi:hypothetical protein
MVEESALAGNDGGCTPTPPSTYYHHVQSCSVRSLYFISTLYVLCDLARASLIPDVDTKMPFPLAGKPIVSEGSRNLLFSKRANFFVFFSGNHINLSENVGVGFVTRKYNFANLDIFP